MLKIFVGIVFAISLSAGPVSAHGGGPAETMPMTNFTDLPDYRPRPLTPCVRGKQTCYRARWHQGLSRGN